MKVSVFDKNLRKQFVGWCASLGAFLSIFVIFVDIPKKYKIGSGILFLVLLFIIFVILWLKANFKREASIKIGRTTVKVKSGNIFDEEGLIAIAFNEYFDTLVDDKVISKASLNGQFILNEIKDIERLDYEIAEDLKLQSNISGYDKDRERGKPTRYNLGSAILIDERFILTAFSHFNSDNQAELTMPEYINFLLTFWNEINRLYAQRSVTVPVFGAGITRFKNGFEDIELDELLRIMLWTFRVSKVKFVYPAKLTIIIHKDQVAKINLYELEETNNGV